MAKSYKKKYRTIGSNKLAKTIRNFVEGNIRRGKKSIKSVVR